MILLKTLDFPFIYKRNNYLEHYAKHHNQKVTASALESDEEVRKRNILYLVRCPFHRVISSYEYRTHRRFNRVKNDYLAKRIDLHSMDIIEYIKFLDTEIKRDQYNSIIEHFLPQKKSFYVSAYEGTKIKILWQTEKINELLDLWNQAFDINLDIKQKRNKQIRDNALYYYYYIKHPTLLGLVKEVFKEDLDWLNPIFNYEERFSNHAFSPYSFKYLKNRFVKLLIGR